MIITYFRSSSLGNWSYCQHQYFMNYVLGQPTSTSHKAKLGTCVHKILECLGNIKKYIQDNNIGPTDEFVYDEDNELGSITIDMKFWLVEQKLSDDQILKINRTRRSKDKYKHPCELKSGDIRRDPQFVETIINNIYDYYSEDYWAPVDFKDVTNWTWMALEYLDGEFDPRMRDIIEAEPYFDIEIAHDWAAYDYIIQGEKVAGQLSIKGTIDLITHVGDGIYEIVDWKTGQRRNWAKNKEKKYDDLERDVQLMLYYYASKHLFPEAKQIIVTIFFVRDGGPYTICFDENSAKQMEASLRARFEEIQGCEIPKMLDSRHVDFRCKRLCSYYKAQSPQPGVNMCDFIHKELHQIGMDKVVDKYTVPGHSVHKYHSPGEKK